MEKNRRYFIMLCCLLNVMVSQAQEIFATTDQKVYVAGEKIWVSGKLWGNGASDLEEVRIFLLNRIGQVVGRQQVLLHEGKYFAGLPIKDQTPSDNYVVAIWAGGFFRSFMPVMIINPVIPPQRIVSARAESQVKAEEPRSLALKVSSEQLHTREEVEVEVGDPVDIMDYFVSVTRKDALSDYADSLFKGWNYADARKILPQDIPGVQVNAKVTNSAGQPVEGVQVLSSLLSNQADLGYAVSNKDGQLSFVHPYHYADPPLVLTPLGQENYKFALETARDSFDVNWNLPVLDLPLRFDPAISDRLTQLTVSQAYQQGQKTKLMATQIDTTDFYGAPDKRYILDNYTRFPDMQEILQEFIPEVRVKRNGDKPILQVVNMPYKQYFEQEALVLLDGVPVTDIAQLLSLDPLKIYAIDVVARKFFLEKMQFHGIVHYKTYKTDLAGYRMPARQMVFDMQGLGLPTVPAYPLLTDPRIPDLRNTIFWLAPGSLPGKRFRFSTLDATGTYQIRVTGLNRDGVVFMGEKEIRTN